MNNIPTIGDEALPPAEPSNHDIARHALEIRALEHGVSAQEQLGHDVGELVGGHLVTPGGTHRTRTERLVNWVLNRLDGAK